MIPNVPARRNRNEPLHLNSNRNFRNLWHNGKHPIIPVYRSPAVHSKNQDLRWPNAGSVFRINQARQLDNLKLGRLITQRFFLVVVTCAFQMSAAGFSLITRRIAPKIFRTFCRQISPHLARNLVPLSEVSRRTFSLSR